MKKVFFVLVLFLMANSGYCDYSFSTTEYNPKPFYYQNYPQSFSPNKTHYSQRAFNNLERKILNHNFMTESPSQRLNRMEESIFGTIQQGNINSRYRALQRALSDNSNYRHYSPHHNTIRQKNFFNRFTGMPTGFTPPINTQNFEFPFDSNYNFQSGMKFKIIDDY